MTVFPLSLGLVLLHERLPVPLQQDAQELVQPSGEGEECPAVPHPQAGHRRQPRPRRRLLVSRPQIGVSSMAMPTLFRRHCLDAIELAWKLGDCGFESPPASTRRGWVVVGK